MRRTVTALRHTRLARWPVIAVLGVLATPALAAGAAQDSALKGSGINKLSEDTRRLTVKADATAVTGAAEGRVSFAHHSPIGVSRFKGDVSCLQVAGSVAQISGRVSDGETASGVVLTGKQFAFTVRLGGEQAFSLPKFAADDAVRCGGGQATQVRVTGGGFKTR